MIAPDPITVSKYPGGRPLARQRPKGAAPPSAIRPTACPQRSAPLPQGGPKALMFRLAHMLHREEKIRRQIAAQMQILRHNLRPQRKDIRAKHMQHP